MKGMALKRLECCGHMCAKSNVRLGGKMCNKASMLEVLIKSSTKSCRSTH